MSATLLVVLSAGLAAAAAAQVGNGVADPRIPLVEQQLDGQLKRALAQTESLLAREPGKADDLWIGYLQGDLLERLGRLDEANNVFQLLLSSDSEELALFSRLRMASLLAKSNHPEVAAGLVANLLGQGSPTGLAPKATDILTSALRQGADCRLLGRLGAWVVPEPQRRDLNLSLAECLLASEQPETAIEPLIDLLDQETADLVGRQAAVHLSGLESPAIAQPQVQIAIGLAFHHNREFERAIDHLERGLSALDPERLTVSPDTVQVYRYANARAYFWLRDYAKAAQLFGELAATADRQEIAARAYYQEARCHELAGDWRTAAATFRESFLAQRDGEWSAPALFSALRIEFRGGHEETALDLFEVLDSQPGWRNVARRAALFLTATDLERGRVDRAANWLRRDPGKEAIEEFLYWSARLAEMESSPHVAIRNYVEIIMRDRHHPLAEAAWRRLERQPLTDMLEPIGQQLAASARRTDLHRAWILLGDDSPGGQAARDKLLLQLRADQRSNRFIDLEMVPPRDWPLWTSPLDRPGELMLALGMWEEGAPYMGRYFPYSEPSLAFSSAALLADAGLTRHSLRIAETLANAIPPWLPDGLLPLAFRQQLYPFPFRAQIERQARRQGLDPALLAGLIREESRFDPAAVSAAAARGLSQFVYPTALEVAASIGLDLDDPSRLHQPEVAITLGAAYLSQLGERFDQRTAAAITAYNAGEDQTRLWRSYCVSHNPAEYYTKVGFAQTRGYLRKVSRSRSQYQALYAAN